jgi:hypothetical protein
MRRAASVSLLAAAIALAALALAPAASAAGGGGSLRGFSPRLSLRGPHGYRLTVSRRAHAVALTVVRGRTKRRAAATSYVARGTATPRLLRASLGSFGGVSMRFVPSTEKAKLGPHGHCEGPLTPLVRRGVFVGHLRFRGEGGYLSVDVHRAKGKDTRFSRRCLRQFIRNHRGHHHRLNLLRPAPGGGSSHEVTYLAAQWKGATASQTFLALALGKKTAFLATTSGDAGRISIYHLALALSSHRGAFSLNDALTGGRVDPGAPFNGSGSYGAAADGTRTWEGPLSVDFPGSPRFGLTGPLLEPSVGTLPALFALLLLKSAKAADPLALAAATAKPSLLSRLAADAATPR